ncbi:MAG: hypothetical protein SPL96_08745 [Bacteroidales bacterium]|nr:hypothetical protein [Bacteroidales bacterium]
MRNWLFAILTLIFTIPPLAAQEVEWSVDASTVINNREGGDDRETPDQTIAFTRLAPEVGVSLMEGTHVLKGGVVWFQPMIDNMNGYKILPTLYYRYNDKSGWHVTAGLLPRSLMVERSPRYMWSDSLNYCQPNIRGIMVQLIKPTGYTEALVDWRQLQTENQREAFTIMANTDWRIAGPMRLGGHIQYSHLAMSRHHGEDQHVNDDVIINPMASLDLSGRTILDSLRLSAGAIIAMQRDRGTNHWNRPAGFLATATARWRWIELDETFYTGQRLMPLYAKFGSQLIQGDPHYNNKTYSRTDLVFHIVSNRFIDLTGSLMLHVTNKYTGFWQQVACRFYLDNNLWKRRHDNNYLKSGRLQQLY